MLDGSDLTATTGTLNQMMHIVHELPSFVASGWFEIKALLMHVDTISRDSIHVIAGVLIQLTAAAVLRTPISRPAPWLIVLGAELVNEWVDFYIEVWPDRGMQIGEGVKDVLLTMFLPTALLLVSRRFPALLS